MRTVDKNQPALNKAAMPPKRKPPAYASGTRCVQWRLKLLAGFAPGDYPQTWGVQLLAVGRALGAEVVDDGPVGREQVIRLFFCEVPNSVAEETAGFAELLKPKQ